VPLSQTILSLLRTQGRSGEGTSWVKGSRVRSWPVVTTDGTGVVSHAGTALLRELAERSGLRAEYSGVLDGLRRRGGGHDPGQVLVDVAVVLADGGEAGERLQRDAVL